MKKQGGDLYATKRRVSAGNNGNVKQVNDDLVIWSADRRRVCQNFMSKM